MAMYSNDELDNARLILDYWTVMGNAYANVAEGRLAPFPVAKKPDGLLDKIFERQVVKLGSVESIRLLCASMRLGHQYEIEAMVTKKD